MRARLFPEPGGGIRRVPPFRVLAARQETRDGGDMSREGRQVGLHRLMVTDVGADLAVGRDANRAGRQWDTGLGHQHRQTDRLQRDGLAAGVRSRQDQHAIVGFDRQRHRDALPVRIDQTSLEQRMSQGLERQRSVGLQLGNRRTDLAAEQRPRLHGVQFGQLRHTPLDLVGSIPEGVGPFEQDASDLLLFELGQPDELVVQLDRLERLDEAGRAR